MAKPATTGVFTASGLGRGVTVIGNPGRTDNAVAAPVTPAMPPVLAVSPVREFILSTVGGTITLPATGIGKVSGGTPTVIETEIDGRVAGTSLGDRTRRTVEIEAGLFGRLGGRDQTGVVDALVKVAQAGRLIRLYGPLNRTGHQGMVWTLAEPSPTETGMRGDGRINHAEFTLTFSEWTPPDSIVQSRGASGTKRARGIVVAGKGVVDQARELLS